MTIKLQMNLEKLFMMSLSLNCFKLQTVVQVVGVIYTVEEKGSKGDFVLENFVVAFELKLL